MLRKLSNILSLLHQFAFEIVETRKKRMEGKSWEFLTFFSNTGPGKIKERKLHRLVLRIPLVISFYAGRKTW